MIKFSNKNNEFRSATWEAVRDPEILFLWWWNGSDIGPDFNLDFYDFIKRNNLFLCLSVSLFRVNRGNRSGRFTELHKTRTSDRETWKPKNEIPAARCATGQFENCRKHFLSFDKHSHADEKVLFPFSRPWCLFRPPGGRAVHLIGELWPQPTHTAPITIIVTINYVFHKSRLI